MPRNNSYLSPEDLASGYSLEEKKIVFGKKVRNLMLSLSMNQSDLARAAGLKRDAVSTYIRGKAFPDPANLRKLANALGVTSLELIPGLHEIADATVARTSVVIPRSVVSMPAPAMQMDLVKPGMFRLRVDQVLPYATTMQILALLNQNQPTSGTEA